MFITQRRFWRWVSEEEKMKVKVVRGLDGSLSASICGFVEDTREQILAGLPQGSELVEIVSANSCAQEEALDVFGVLVEFQRDEPDSLGAALESLFQRVFEAGYKIGHVTGEKYNQEHS